MGRKVNLADIVKSCEARFGQGSAADWKHSHFCDLSQEILRDTEVNISPKTLKRIFGKISVDDDYQPQQATIEALLQYGGYVPPETTGQPEGIRNAEERIPDAKDPEIFKDEPVIIKDKPEGIIINEPGVVSKPGRMKLYKSVLIAVAMAGIVICGLIALKIVRSRSEGNPSGSIILSSTEGLLPATAVFKLKFSQAADSLFVEFGDKSPPVPVQPGQDQIAHNYLIPGVFKVRLQTRQTVLDSMNICIRSDKWIGLAFHRQGALPDRYYEFPAVKTGSDSLFHIENGQLQKMGMDTVLPFFTRLCNFSPVKGASEDFVLETTFKNSLPGKGIYCRGTQFHIAGINGFIRFKLTNPGCSYRVINVMGEQTFDGSKANLSQFVTDLEKWNSVKLINRNKEVSLFVNGKLLFTGSYKKPLGQIQGLFLEFEGNGFVKNCDLKSNDGKILYQL